MHKMRSKASAASFPNVCLLTPDAEVGISIPAFSLLNNSPSDAASGICKNAAIQRGERKVCMDLRIAEMSFTHIS